MQSTTGIFDDVIRKPLLVSTKYIPYVSTKKNILILVLIFQ